MFQEDKFAFLRFEQQKDSIARRSFVQNWRQL